MCEAKLMPWTAEEHHADRTAISFSMLKHAGAVTEDGEELNPGLFRAHWEREVPANDSVALNFGTVQHMAVYEPDRLESEVAVRPTKPNGDLIRSNSKEFKEWAKKHEGKRFLRPEEWQTIQSIMQACRKSPALQSLHRLEKLYDEQSIVWRDEETGLLLKIRPDRILRRRDGQWVVVDLKTAEEVHPRAFRRACEKYRYFDRLAFYLDGIESLTGRSARGVLVAAAKKSPYQVPVYEPRPHRIDEGRTRNRALLHEIARCFETNNWTAPWETVPVLL